MAETRVAVWPHATEEELVHLEGGILAQCLLERGMSGISSTTVASIEDVDDTAPAQASSHEDKCEIRRSSSKVRWQAAVEVEEFCPSSDDSAVDEPILTPFFDEPSTQPSSLADDCELLATQILKGAAAAVIDSELSPFADDEPPPPPPSKEVVAAAVCTNAYAQAALQLAAAEAAKAAALERSVSQRREEEVPRTVRVRSYRRDSRAPAPLVQRLPRQPLTEGSLQKAAEEAWEDRGLPPRKRPQRTGSGGLEEPQQSTVQLMHFQPAAFADESGQRKTVGREARLLLEEEVPRLARGKSPAQPAEEVKSAPTDKCAPKLTEAQSRRLQQPLVGRTNGAMRAAAAPLVSSVGDTSDAWQQHMVGLGRDSAIRGAQMKSAPADIQPAHEVHGDKWSQAVMHLFRSAPLRGELAASGSGSDLKKFRPVPRRPSLNEYKSSFGTGMQLVPAASTSDEARRAQEYLTSTREGWLDKADAASTKPAPVAPALLRTEVAPERRIAEPSVAPKEASPPAMPQPRVPAALTPSTPAQSGERFFRSGRQWKVQGRDSEASHAAATKVQGFWRKKRDARQQAMTQQTWREVMARPAVQRARSMPQALPQEVVQTQTLEEIAPAAASPEPVTPVETHVVSTAEASRSLCVSVYQAARRTISALDADAAQAVAELRAERGPEMDEAHARQEAVQVATPELQATEQEATPPVQLREASTSEIKAADAKASAKEEVPVQLAPRVLAEPPMLVDNNAEGKRFVEEDGGTAADAAQDEQRVQLVKHTRAIKDGNSPLVAKDSHTDDTDSIGISTPTSELHDDISILASDDEDESAPAWGVVHWIPQPQESTLPAAQVDLHELARGNQELVATAPPAAAEAPHLSPRPPKGRAPPEGVVARKPAGPKPVRKLPAGLEARLAALAHPVPAVAAQEIAAANAVLWDGSRSPRVPADEDWSARGHRWRPKDLPSMVVPEPITKHVAYMELQPHTWAQAVPGLAKGKRQKQQEAALPSIALPRRYDLAKTGKIARLHAVVAPPRRDMLGA